MGLDWLPGNKPKPGCEEEYQAILDALEEAGNREEKGFFAKLLSRETEPEVDEEALIERFHEVSISAFETLDAPRVGHDEAANDWARRMREENKPDVPEEEWMEHYEGYYVLDLMPPCDGIPRYSNGGMGYVESYSFRGKVLGLCTDIIGDERYEKGFERMRPAVLVAYGKELIACAETWAAEHGVDIDAGIPEGEEIDLEDPGLKVDMVLSAGRWCIYWGERGHILDPYY